MTQQAEKKYQCAVKGHIPEVMLAGKNYLLSGVGSLTTYLCARCKLTVHVSAEGDHNLAGEEYGGK